MYKTVKGTLEGKAEVQKELIEGLEVLIKNNIDLIIVEVSEVDSNILRYFHCLVLPQH